jgi:signal transduction histidine kinase
MSAGELRELAAVAAVEVERVCKLFGYLRELVRAENTRPQLSSTPILPLLADVVDGVKLLYEEDGMSINSIVPDICQPVFIDRARAVQALSSVLLIAHGVSRAPDTVEVIVTSPTVNAVQIVVRNLNPHFESMNAEARLGMALAEAEMRSPQASFSWCPGPFSVLIGLPSAPIMGHH